jgi:hypothetical protein
LKNVSLQWRPGEGPDAASLDPHVVWNKDSWTLFALPTAHKNNQAKVIGTKLGTSPPNSTMSQFPEKY